LFYEYYTRITDMRKYQRIIDEYSKNHSYRTTIGLVYILHEVIKVLRYKCKICINSINTPLYLGYRLKYMVFEDTHYTFLVTSEDDEESDSLARTQAMRAYELESMFSCMVKNIRVHHGEC
jgi:uncharacterized protein involved in tolerance to divalent cations